MNDGTDQQSTGAVDGYTAGKRVVDGEIADRCRWVVTSFLIHVSVHMEMDRVVSHCLLAHVLQLHPRYMNYPEAPLHLIMTEEVCWVRVRGDHSNDCSFWAEQKRNVGKGEGGNKSRDTVKKEWQKDNNIKRKENFGTNLGKTEKE